MTNENFNLPTGPSDLCFDTTEFMTVRKSTSTVLFHYKF